MTAGHPRLVLAVLGGVLAALVALGVVIVSGGGGARSSADVAGAPTYDAAPAPASLGGPAADQGSSTVSRSAPRRALTVDPAWAASTGARAGIPARAMVAYGTAALRLQRTQPTCNLSWNTLAGIGWVESHHGTIGGRALLEDGRSSELVLGPALNGQGFAAIRSTRESARWHGDRTWEHAVGPLQFIASTWERWGTDGDGDGVADPTDLDDAALSAGRYLCADGHDLATGAGWGRAVHSYNHDNAYVLNVLSAANTYAERAR